MLETIVDSFDIWGTSLTQKSKGKKAGIENISFHGINRLRELILELAVRGKLVEQNSDEEPANILLEDIKTEKKRLVKIGIIKKQKLLQKISDDEKPFNIPSNWVWQRIGEIGYTQTGGTPSKNDKSNFGNDIPFIKPGDIYPKNVDYLNEGLSEKGKEKLGRVAPSGSILMVCIGTIGKCNSIDRECSFNQQINSVSPYIQVTDFLLLALKSRYFQNKAWDNSSSTTIAILNKGKWESIIIPLPPLDEQQRIVTKVYELMALCDKLEQEQMNHIETHLKLVEALLQTLTAAKNAEELKGAWQYLEPHFDILFTTEESIELLKQTILQLAVMGKLVPQNPNDEPASVLLEKITAEKQRLIKEGKIKKQKPLPEITDDEKPFDMPTGWEWTKFGEVYDVTSSKRIHVSDYVSDGIPFFRSKEIGELMNNKEISTEYFIKKDKFEELKTLSGFPNKGDLMLTSVGSIGNTWINDGREFYYKDGNITKIGRNKYADMHFVKYFIQSPLFKNQVKDSVSGTAYNALTIIKIKNLFFPLCSLMEQKRIVTKVNELLTLCDQLKERIVATQELKVKLADAVVEQAVKTKPEKVYEVNSSLDMAAEPERKA